MNSLVYFHLMLGPLMLVLAFVYKRFPPKKINPIYGYRTPRSMRSQKAWDCANLYCSNAFVVVSGLTCVVQVINYSLIGGKNSVQWSAYFLVAGLIAVIPLTELHLKRKGFK